MILHSKDDKGIEITVEIPDDANLTTAFAYFVRFTDMIGYHAQSWEHVLKDDVDFDNKYTLFDWAVDRIYSEELF